MKTIKTFTLISLLIVGTTTSVFASWWNPFTWSFFKKKVQTQQVSTLPASVDVGNRAVVATTTLSISGSSNPVAVIADDNTKNKIIITSPSEGDVLSADKKSVVRWEISKDIIDSFPKDFNLNISFYIQEQGKEGYNITGIGDGHDISDTAILWDIPSIIKYNNISADTKYKIVANLQATPKDRKRLCAVHGYDSCSPSEDDIKIMSRSVAIKGESGWFKIEKTGLFISASTSKLIFTESEKLVNYKYTDYSCGYYEKLPNCKDNILTYDEYKGSSLDINNVTYKHIGGEKQKIMQSFEIDTTTFKFAENVDKEVKKIIETAGMTKTTLKSFSNYEKIINDRTTQITSITPESPVKFQYLIGQDNKNKYYLDVTRYACGGDVIGCVGNIYLEKN